MAGLSEVKKRILELSDSEILTLLGIAEKKATHIADINTDGKTRWFDKKVFGLDAEGFSHLKHLQRMISISENNPRIDYKQYRYLKRLSQMDMSVPSIFRDNTNPKDLYKHLIEFCNIHDIPSEVVNRLVPAFVQYYETGHMRPVMFVGEAGCGKTTAAKLLIEEALQLPTEIVKLPQLDGSHGLTGDCASYQSADVGCLAQARLRTNSLLVAYIFDEIDKVNHGSNRANVDDALLSVTDESNCKIYDNYLQSNITGLEFCPMFFTANDLQKVSPILADRCSVIHFPSASADRVKSILRKYVEKQLSVSSLYHSVRFDFGLMDKYVDNLVKQHSITSLRRHQQMVENVLGKALACALEQSSDDTISITDKMFDEAENTVLGGIKRSAGFVR